MRQELQIPLKNGHGDHGDAGVETHRTIPGGDVAEAAVEAESAIAEPAGSSQPSTDWFCLKDKIWKTRNY